MYDLLQFNIFQNNLQNKVIPYNYAVFCDQIKGTMNCIDLDGGGGIVIKRYNEEINKPCNFGGICLGKYGEEVNMITIDDNMEHKNIGFIHCDAQGSENFIFSKAINTIKENRPVILYENNEKYGKYLFNNVCVSYPQYIENSKFNLENYCINELNYSTVIKKFGGGQDDLLIP
uniref:Methyltransferase FkbM domain-containing protein n=1 Tax=viral metagenome TaxID=1070528 RepID=A0A6C0KHF8_9ZZZZ